MTIFRKEFFTPRHLVYHPASRGLVRGPKLKVGYVVVIADAVFVMNVFVIQKLPPNVFFHDATMLQNNLPVFGFEKIAIAVLSPGSRLSSLGEGTQFPPL